MFNLTNNNKKISKQSNSLIKNNKKKISISIYSNPYSIKFPFSNQPNLNNNLNNLYKITSEKIQNNKNDNKHEHKLTISNLLSMVQSNNSILHNSINKSVRNQVNLRNDLAHGGHIEVTIENVKKYFNHGRTVLDWLESVF